MSWDILKIIIASAFTVFGTILAGLFIAGVNKFNNVCNMMLTHDFKIKDLSEQVDSIDNKIDHIKEDVIKAQQDGIKMFAEELHPLNKRVEEVELEVRKIKIHTNFNEDRSSKVNR